MARQPFHRHALGDRLDHALRLAGRAGADRITERDLGAAHIVKLLRHDCHGLGLDLAFVRAAEHAGDVAAHPHAILLGRRQHRLEPLDALGDGAVDVLLRERLRRRAEHRHVLGACRERRLEALHVRHQHRIGHARMAIEAAHDLAVVGHLRHPLG